jgi:Xaa-Pro aminopeptidase
MDLFAERRQRLLGSLGGVAVFFAAPVALRNGDVEHEYRQDSDFFYLTGFDERQSVLVLSPRHPQHKAVLFVRPRSADGEVWDGARAGVEGAAARPGIDAAYPIGELAQRLPEMLLDNTRLYHRLGQDRAADEIVIEAVRKARGRGRSPRAWPTEIVDPAPILGEMRLHKDEHEIARMRRAAEITRDAHLAAMRLAAPGRWEYELEAAFRETCRRRGAERLCYLPIVGSGPNACVLHYRANRRCIEDGDLVLVDAGCELEYYGSDVTRTFPANGTFSAPQRAIYEIVLEAQRAAVEAVKPGATVDGIHEVAASVIARGLAKLGLTPADPKAEPGYRKFYMHRTSHWLGMDVHDAGLYYLDGQPRPLAPGMVLTVEPGIYIGSSDDSVPAEYRGIGVRIEDDVLVTPDGHHELTHDIPRDVAEIERACRG